MNILTFDVEDWFHLLDCPATATVNEWKNYKPRIHANLDRILELLQRHDYKATFFCVGWMAEQYSEIIRNIDELGYEIASHSHMHQLVYQQTPRQFRDDLRRSIYTLEDITGRKVKTYRAPGYSLVRDNPWAFETLVDLGIEMDSSIFPTALGHGGYKDFGPAQPCILESRGGRLKEFPINLGLLFGREIIFSGGGYFRLLPYRTIQRLTQQADYLMAYFHPRDFDVEQPVLDLPLYRRFKSYVGLKGAYAKFDRWLEENHFTDIAGAEEEIDWSVVPRIQV